MRKGSRFRGIFTNDKVTGWGIYEHGDGDIYKGEYENDHTYGYGNIPKEITLYITDIGKTVYNLELGMKYGEILLNILGNIIMEKKMG